MCVFLLLSICKFSGAFQRGFSTSTRLAGLSSIIRAPQVTESRPLGRSLRRNCGVSVFLCVWYVCIYVLDRYLPALRRGGEELNAENLNIHRTHTLIDNFTQGACGHRLLYFYRDCRASAQNGR